MNQQIEKIIVKFFMNVIDIDELKILTNWLKKSVNKELFKSYAKTNFVIDIIMDDFDTENAKKEYLLKIKKDKSIFYRYRINNILKYVAAIFIGILATSYFFKDHFFNPSIELIDPVIVNNQIVPGNDKATLTLEDGSIVELTEDKPIQTQNATSNGKGLVYINKSTNEIKYNYLTIPRGGQFFIKLSDGTQVWLNSESQLKYPVAFAKGETRNVELLYGEAYFDVAPSSENHGTKFQVHHNSQEIEVLGTEFNVKAYKDEYSIYTTLVEGKVTVSNGVNTKKLLPNQQSKLNTNGDDQFRISIVDVQPEVSWKEGEFKFKEKPLKDIMKVLSRWYDIDVIFENKNMESINFKGTLKKNQSIKEVLSIMKSTTINNYEINNKTLIIK
jgi:hypothetical protein